jgi:hypothetical protein
LYPIQLCTARFYCLAFFSKSKKELLPVALFF